MTTELLILRNLIHNEDFTRRTLPYLQSEYFQDRIERTLYEQINQFVQKYNSLPTKEALTIEIDDNAKLSDEEFAQCSSLIHSLDYEEADSQWLTDTVEKWCQERAIYNAIMNSIQILDGGDASKDKGSIPDL